MEYVGYIYCVTCLVNGKMYIGQTTIPIHKRWKHHIQIAFSKRCKYRFHRAIKKYGPENFCVEEVLSFKASSIEKLSEKLNYAEIRLIDRLVTFGEEGYNSTIGGDTSINLGHHLSEEHRRKLSVSKRGERNPMYGKHFSDDQKAKLSKSLRANNRHLTEEQKRHLAEMNIGKSHPAWNRGIPMSEEQKEKLSKKLKGVPAPWNRRPCSAEKAKKISEKLKGNIPWNKGLKLKRA